MKALILSLLMVLSPLAPSALAGGDGLVDYMPLAFFNSWLLQQENMIDGLPPDPKDTTTIKVVNVRQENGVVLYSVRSPIFDELTDVVLDFGIEGDTLSIYGARIVPENEFDDLDAKIPKLRFVDTPVFVAGGGTNISDGPVESVISTKIKVKVEFGPFSGSATIDVNGSFFTDWMSPIEGGPGDVRLEIQEVLTFSSEDDDLDDLDETSDKTAGVTLSQALGFLQVDGKGSKSYGLRRAILPGATYTAEGFTDPKTGLPFADDPIRLTSITIPGPEFGGLFTLDGQAGESTTGGGFQLTEIELTHDLGGKLELNAMVSQVPEMEGEPSTEVPITLKGKAKFNAKTAMAQVSLKGKTKALELETGTLVIKAKGLIDVGATLPPEEGPPPPQQLALAYKAGKTDLGEPVEGEMLLDLTPVTGTELQLDLNGAVDTQLLPKGKSRTIGSEGTLTMGAYSVPVVMIGKLKPGVDGEPDKRGYKLRPVTSSKPTLAKFGALSQGTDFTLFKVASKLNGTKIKLKEATGVMYTAEDPTLEP